VVLYASAVYLASSAAPGSKTAASRAKAYQSATANRTEAIINLKPINWLALGGS